MHIKHVLSVCVCVCLMAKGDLDELDRPLSVLEESLPPRLFLSLSLSSSSSSSSSS